MRVLVASDGSAAACAALDAAIGLPWPSGTRARGVVALGRVGWGGPEFRAAVVQSLHAGTEEMRRQLKRRWPDADVLALHDSPAEAILSEARRFRADAIVLGWRGHGAFARLLAGSVSRAAAEQARCSVVIVREGYRTHTPGAGRFAVGFDGSENSRKAIRFLASLEPRRGNRIMLVNVLEPLLVPPLSRATAEIRAKVRQAVARQEAARVRRAEKRLRHAAGFLRRRGWHVTARVQLGAPLYVLLGEARRSRAEVLVVGARGAGGVRRMLLGSVASGAVNQSAIPVVVAR
jgi:nucleotide-binding universal stress UspA family protein